MSDQDIEDDIVAAIRRIIRAVDLHSRRLHDAHGLTGPQLATLREAARLGPVTAGVLARQVSLSQATITGIATRLERRGLVERRRGEPDRRTVRISVTTMGHQILESAPSLLQERFRRELALLEPWERTATLATLQRISAMMGAEELSAAPHLVSGTIHATDAERPGEERA